MSHPVPSANLPEENDPLHDINGPQVTLWLVGTAVALFIGLFFLYAVFGVSVKGTREGHYENYQPESTAVFAEEEQILAGKALGEPDRKDIETVMQEMADR